MRLHPALVAALAVAPSLARAQQPQRAALTFARGSVEVTSGAPPEAHAARPGEPLARGDRVQVGDEGSAEITLPNGTVLELEERTQVMLFASPLPVAADQPLATTTTIARGTVRVRMAPPGRAEPELLPLSAGAATAFVGRCDAMLAADLGGHIARAAVHRGRMRIRTVAREYILRAGSGATEEFGRPPMPLRQLLPQPVWTSPPPARVVSGGEAVDVRGAYGFAAATSAQPAHWRVQVARDAAFHDVLSESTEPGAARQWVGRGLAPGRYFVRVVAVDQERFETLPSAAAPITIAAPRVEPSRPAAGGEPGVPAQVVVPEGFLCGLDGAELHASGVSIPLAPGRAHRLRCAASEGSADVRETTISASQSGPLVRDVAVRGVDYGAGVLGLRLFDAAGQTVPYAEVTVTADRGVTVDAVREARERGVYNAVVHWPRGVLRARFRFTVNGAETFEQELSQDR